MNKNILIAGILIAVLAGGLYVFSDTDKSGDTMTTDTPRPNQVRERMGNTKDNETGELPALNSYQDYSPELAASAAEDKKVVLFFHAPWCPTCIAANKEFIEEINNIPQDILILKTDYDSSTELKKRYSVNYQHTFVQVDAEGNEITKWNGGALDEIIEQVK